MPKKINFGLGDVIAQTRKDKNLLAEEVARKTKICAPYLSSIENSRKKPSIKALKRLSKVLGTTPEKLLFAWWRHNNPKKSYNLRQQIGIQNILKEVLEVIS